MKIAVTVHLTLLALTVCCVSAEDGCYEGPRSVADVCAQLEEKLQLAVSQDPTNMYLIKRVWANPVPSIVNIVYDVNIFNKSSTSCAKNDNETELVETSITFEGSLWTDRGLFTLLHPGTLQQLQLQFPYMILQLATLLIGTDNPFGSFVLSSILWNGCQSSSSETVHVQGLPNITLVLNIDYLSCTPSKRQLETSLHFLTSWLRAYENLQPGSEQPELDIEKRRFFFSTQFTVRSSFIILKLIAFPVYFFLFWAMLLGAKRLLKYMADDKTSEVDTKQLFTPTIIVVGTWNVLILIADVVSFIQCPPNSHNTQAFKLALFISVFSVIPVLAVIIICFHHKLEYDLQKLNLIDFAKNKKMAKVLFVFGMWNVFMFVAYFFTSVIAALLLAFVYPFQVLAVASFLVAGVAFNILLFSVILPPIPKYVRSVNFLKHSHVLPSYLTMESICQVFIYLSYVIVVLLVNVVLLSLFGVAILRGLVSNDSATGRLIALLPTIVLAFASFLLKYNVNATEETANKTTATTPTDDNPTQMTKKDGTCTRIEIENPLQAESIPATKTTAL